MWGVGFPMHVSRDTHGTNGQFLMGSVVKLRCLLVRAPGVHLLIPVSLEGTIEFRVAPWIFSFFPLSTRAQKDILI